jgi:hypothetical protein
LSELPDLSELSSKELEEMLEKLNEREKYLRKKLDDGEEKY